MKIEKAKMPYVFKSKQRGRQVLPDTQEVLDALETLTEPDDALCLTFDERWETEMMLHRLTGYFRTRPQWTVSIKHDKLYVFRKSLREDA